MFEKDKCPPGENSKGLHMQWSFKLVVQQIRGKGESYLLDMTGCISMVCSW